MASFYTITHDGTTVTDAITKRPAITADPRLYVACVTQVNLDDVPQTNPPYPTSRIVLGAFAFTPLGCSWCGHPDRLDRGTVTEYPEWQKAFHPGCEAEHRRVEENAKVASVRRNRLGGRA